jgi:hypothetical protein
VIADLEEAPNYTRQPVANPHEYDGDLAAARGLQQHIPPPPLGSARTDFFYLKVIF